MNVGVFRVKTGKTIGELRKLLKPTFDMGEAQRSAVPVSGANHSGESPLACGIASVLKVLDFQGSHQQGREPITRQLGREGTKKHRGIVFTSRKPRKNSLGSQKS